MIFQKFAKLAIFGNFNELLSTQNVNVARFARECDFFCDFQTLCKGADKATDGFHTAQDNEGRVTCTKIKLFCLLMMKCYDKSEVRVTI